MNSDCGSRLRCKVVQRGFWRRAQMPSVRHGVHRAGAAIAFFLSFTFLWACNEAAFTEAEADLERRTNSDALGDPDGDPTVDSLGDPGVLPDTEPTPEPEVEEDPEDDPPPVEEEEDDRFREEIEP